MLFYRQNITAEPRGPPRRAPADCFVPSAYAASLPGDNVESAVIGANKDLCQSVAVDVRHDRRPNWCSNISDRPII